MSGALLFGLGVGLIVLFHAAQVVCGRALGIVPESVGLFVGPKLASFKAGGTEYRLNLVPSGGAVDFGDQFSELPALKQCLVVLSGPVALLAFGFLLYGFSGSPGLAFLRAIPQLLQGAFSPSEVGASLVRAYMSLLAANPVAAIGVLALKVSALNLLPFPGSPGGMIWRSVLRLKAEDPRLLVPRLLGSIAGMGLGFSWLAAIWQGLA